MPKVFVVVMKETSECPDSRGGYIKNNLKNPDIPVNKMYK